MGGLPADRCGIVIIGCGYVADYYQATLANHPILRVEGVYDRDAGRARSFAGQYGYRSYESLESALGDAAAGIVVNLTSPQSHFEVSRAALEAGKHVYSEKPLALDLDEARELADLARSRGLQIAGAPCSALGEAAQTMWRALRQGRIGRPLVAYAELDDGQVHRMHPDRWKSASGTPWPARNEFATGCTMEHAGYYVSWLAMFFGPVRRVVSFSRCLVPDKWPDLSENEVAPDFSLGALEFDGGVVARFTCSVVAPRNRSLRVVGDIASLRVREAWDYRARVFLERPTRLGQLPLPLHRARRARFATPKENGMDFCRGVADLAEAVALERPCRLSTEFSLHVTEVTIALQHPERQQLPYEVASTFAAPAPMPWAR